MRDAEFTLTGHSLADAAGRLLAFDDRVCEIMHRSRRELTGMLYSELTFADDLASNVAIVDRARSGAPPVEIWKRYLRPDRSLVWAHVKVSRLSTGSDSGRLVGTLNTFIDEQGPQRLWGRARTAIAEIEARRAELGRDLFLDHPWIVLLQFYVAEAEGRLFERCDQTTDMPLSLFNRWIDVLVQRGFLERVGGVAQLTQQGSTKVEGLLMAQLLRDPTCCADPRK